MYLFKFGQNPSTGLENNARKRSYADTDADGASTQTNMFGGQNSKARNKSYRKERHLEKVSMLPSFTPSGKRKW